MENDSTDLMLTTSIRLPPHTMDILKKEAKRKQLKMSTLCRIILSDYIYKNPSLLKSKSHSAGVLG